MEGINKRISKLEDRGIKIKLPNLKRTEEKKLKELSLSQRIVELYNERFMVMLCYGCCKERINVSADPTAHHISFQPLSVHLAYPGFSEECEQRDS